MIRRIFLLCSLLLLSVSITVIAAEDETNAYSGIDVSNYQGDIDWTAVAEDGIEFAIIKATEGTTFVDPDFYTNMEGANASGIPAGAYHFARFSDVDKAQEEAAFFLEIIAGAEITYAIALDLETDNGADLETLTQAALVFLEVVEEAGYEALIYSGENFFQTSLDYSAFEEYGRWVAKYSPVPPSIDYDIWQYTASGSVSGITGDVDLNDTALDYSLNGNEEGIDNEEDNGNQNEENNTDTENYDIPSSSESYMSEIISAIQADINRKYSTDLAVDGLYGPLTHQGMVTGIQTELNRQFDARLNIDGIYGESTAAAFVNIRSGAAGNLTYLIQAKLAIEGYYDSNPDGIFGPETQTAAESFQAAQELSADGIIGRRSAAALFE